MEKVLQNRKPGRRKKRVRWLRSVCERVGVGLREGRVGFGLGGICVCVWAGVEGVGRQFWYF